MSGKLGEELRRHGLPIQPLLQHALARTHDQKFAVERAFERKCVDKIRESMRNRTGVSAGQRISISSGFLPPTAATAVLASRAETPMRKPPVTSFNNA